MSPERLGAKRSSKPAAVEGAHDPVGAFEWLGQIDDGPGAYPVCRTVSTRVGDLDGNGHLNAIRLGHLYEDARAAFHVTTGRVGGRVLVAQLTLRYLAEGRWPQDVEIGTGVVRLGRSSFVMGQGLFQGGRGIGCCETVLVHTRDGRASPLPDDYRATLVSYLLTEPRPS